MMVELFKSLQLLKVILFKGSDRSFMYSQGEGLYHTSCAALSRLVNVSMEIKKYRPYLLLTIYIDSMHKKEYKPAFDGKP